MLLVDDDEAVARSMRRLLSRAAEVDVVHSAEAAELLIDAGAYYELIVCDLMLNGKSGAEFYRTLRGRGSPLASRIVFLSGYGESSDLTDSIPEVPCLAKPIGAARLLELAMAPSLDDVASPGRPQG